MSRLLSMTMLCIAMVAACQAGPPADADCLDNGDCNFGSACVDFTCHPADCLSHADCPYDTLCDADSFTCEPGCASDGDCASGSTCLEGSCAPLGCTDAHLDCVFGERCDIESGDCYADPDHPSCDPCDPEDPDACGPDGICAYQEKDGPDYSYCRWFCDPADQEPCPYGLKCSPVQGSEDPTKVCWTQCSDYEKGGFLD